MSADLRARCDPEDVAQEVLLAVHRDFERLAPRAPGEFMPWLFGLAENRIRDLVDRVRAAQRHRDPLAGALEADGLVARGTQGGRRAPDARDRHAARRLPRGAAAAALRGSP